MTMKTASNKQMEPSRNGRKGSRKQSKRQAISKGHNEIETALEALLKRIKECENGN